MGELGGMSDAQRRNFKCMTNNSTIKEETDMSSLMIGRRRLLSLTAAGVSMAALGGLSGTRNAHAASGTVRWVSPRGTIEVLDDYPYWVGKKWASWEA